MFEKKVCKGPCGAELDATEENFYARKSAKNGKIYLSPYCRPCERSKSAKSRKAAYSTPEGKARIDGQTSAYRRKPEKAKLISERLSFRYATDFEYRAERKANSKAWKGSNSQRNASNKAMWYLRNKPRLREEWNKRYRTDPEFRLRNNFRRAIWESLRVCGGRKSGRSVLVNLPYTMEELRAHLESLWEPWMTWENYGPLDAVARTWQIDHVTPQALLPFSDFSDPNFLLCWALSNLRPLEAAMNLEKGCRASS